MFLLQLRDQSGQAVVFALLFKAEFFSHRLDSNGLGFHRQSRFDVSHFLRPHLGAGRLQQPVLHAAFVFAPMAIAFISDGAGHHIVQKSTVMADQKHGTRIVLQQLFKQLQGVYVQIVGRFVQHQHVGWASKQASQQQAVALTTRERANR